MVTFLSRLLSRPPANGMGIRLGGRHACLLISSWVALWDLATIAINALGVPTSSYQGAMFPTSSNATAWVIGDTARQILRFP